MYWQTSEVAPDVLKEHGKVRSDTYPCDFLLILHCRLKTHTLTWTLHPVSSLFFVSRAVSLTDFKTGCVLHHYGLTEFKYYTVIFGVSRGPSVRRWLVVVCSCFLLLALGCLTQLVWARGEHSIPLHR